MPIKGLSDQQARFPRLGMIKKGAPKGTLKDLDYFRLDCKDQAICTQFEETYGKEPRQLNFLLLYHTVEENFPCFMEEWNTSGALKVRCDGEHICQYMDKQTQMYVRPQGYPCLRSQGKECGCKEKGRLSFLIPEISRLGSFELTTSSKHDIINLNQQLAAIELSFGSLVGVPMILKRENKEISTRYEKRNQETKQGTGEFARKAATKSLLSIELHPRVASKALMAIQSRQPLLIEAEIEDQHLLAPSDVDDSF